MLEAHTSSQIPTNTYYTFQFTTQVYQYILGIQEFSLTSKDLDQDLRSLGICIREVARGQTTLTIQPILTTMVNARSNVDASDSYVVVTVVAVTQDNAPMQLNTGLGVADGTSMPFTCTNTGTTYLQQAIISGFSFSGNSSFSVTKVTFGAALASSQQSGTVSVQSTATDPSGAKTRATDVGLLINYDQSFSMAAWTPSSYLQNTSANIPNYSSYTNHVAILGGYTVTNTGGGFLMLSGSVSISSGQVNGSATYWTAKRSSSDRTSTTIYYSQDNSVSGVQPVVLSW